MALFSGLGERLRRGFDPTRIATSQALLNGDYGAVAQIAGAQQRQRAAEAQAEAERQALARMQQAAQSLGLTKEQISAMRPEEVSRLIFERSQPRQFGPEGGSVGRPDPVTGAMAYEQAPWQRQVGRSVIGQQPGGPVQEIYQGQEPVAVQPGGAVYGWTNQGPAGGASEMPGINPAAPPASGAPPAGGPAPGAVVNGYRFRGGDPRDRNNWLPVGGAGGGASRPFDASQIPANFTSGRRTPEGNRLVGGVPRSAHLSGDAADFAPRPGQTMRALEADLRRRFPGARVINEGDHVHVQQRGWNVPYHGRRGTTGLRSP